MNNYQTVLQKIHKGNDPYLNFPTAGWSGVWYNDSGAQREIFKRSLDLIDPILVVECGSFVAESAVFMAKHLKSKGKDAVVLCIDTWLAGFDHFVGAPEKINMHFGRQDLFYRFMANVIQNNCQDTIIPFAIDTLNGARVLKWLGLVPTYVYIDASHEQGDVRRDLDAYWDLLPSGGGLLIDDLTGYFPGVVHDWTEFIAHHGLTPVLTEGEKALVVKP